MKKEDVKEPMFVNLHEDNRLSETLVYPFRQSKLVVGRADRGWKPGAAACAPLMVAAYCGCGVLVCYSSTGMRMMYMACSVA